MEGRGWAVGVWRRGGGRVQGGARRRGRGAAGRDNAGRADAASARPVALLRRVRGGSRMRPSRSPGSAANYCVARAFASQSAAACGDRRLLVRARDEGHRRFRLREKVVAGHVSPPSDPSHQCDERTKERSDSEDGKDGLVPLESARSDEQDVEVHRDGLREWGRRRWGRRRGWGRHAQADQLSKVFRLGFLLAGTLPSGRAYASRRRYTSPTPPKNQPTGGCPQGYADWCLAREIVKTVKTRPTL